MDLVQCIPHRTSYALTNTLATSAWAASWKRVYRQVFWLADGYRDAQRIASLLNKPERLITRVIRELTVTGYLCLHTDKKVVQMNVDMLKRSFEMIAPQKEAFAHRFYDRLFADYPQTQSLFAHTDMKRQQGALMATLAVVVAGVDRGDNLVPILEKLGAKHQRYYKVQAEHYPLVGAVLLETFHSSLGSTFTPVMQEAWDQAIELISAHMLLGATPDSQTIDELADED
jgi:methyl-accepting chemotaxis protein